MSSKSLDSISKHNKKTASKGESSSVIPHAVNSAKALENAKARIEEKKEEQARVRRKGIFMVLTFAIVVFIATAGYISWQAYNKSSQQKRQDQAKQAVMDELNKLNVVSKYNDAEKKALFEKIGAEYAAADALGIAPDSDNQADQQIINYMTLQNNDPASTAEAIKHILNLKLETAKKRGYYKGHIFLYWFGNSIVNKTAEEHIDGWGDPNVLSADRAYADGRAKEDRQKLIDGKISPEEVIASVTKEDRLQLHDNMNASGFYESNLMGVDMTSDDGRFESIDKLLSQYTKPGITEIGIISADPGVPPSGKKKEVGFVFLKLDVVLTGQDVAGRYESELNKAKRNMGL